MYCAHYNIGDPRRPAPPLLIVHCWTWLTAAGAARRSVNNMTPHSNSHGKNFTHQHTFMSLHSAQLLVHAQLLKKPKAPEACPNTNTNSHAMFWNTHSISPTTAIHSLRECAYPQPGASHPSKANSTGGLPSPLAQVSVAEPWRHAAAATMQHGNSLRPGTATH